MPIKMSIIILNQLKCVNWKTSTSIRERYNIQKSISVMQLLKVQHNAYLKHPWYSFNYSFNVEFRNHGIHNHFDIK